MTEQPAVHTDDISAAFAIEGLPSRGRIVRLGPVIDEILSRHDYPEAVANLLGEACALAALVGASLKFEGRLIVQAQGDGPVRYVVADYDTSGGLRGYCRFDADKVAEASQGFSRPGADKLLGGGVFVMTIDPEGGKDRYQGVTPIESESLSLCAEQYFAQSEQVPTRIHLAVGQLQTEQARVWRAGGLMVQRLAGDQARGDTDDAWERVQALFATLGDDELIDPLVSPERLLYRLFHEDGVRLFESQPLAAFCRCSEDRVIGMLKSFPAEDRAEMIEPDGHIRVTCEYCSRAYELEPAVLEEAE